MTERKQAIKIAHKLLDNPWMDPDGDECVLARHLLRTIEREQFLKSHADAMAGVTYVSAEDLPKEPYGA